MISYIICHIQIQHAIKTLLFYFSTCDINAKEKTSMNPSSFPIPHPYRSSPLMIELLIRACLCLCDGSISHCGIHLGSGSGFHVFALSSDLSRCLSALQWALPSAAQFLNKGFLTSGWKEEDLASAATLQNLSI